MATQLTDAQRRALAVLATADRLAIEGSIRHPWATVGNVTSQKNGALKVAAIAARSLEARGLARTRTVILHGRLSHIACAITAAGRTVPQ